MPFVAPRDARLGEAEAMKIKIAPESNCQFGSEKCEEITDRKIDPLKMLKYFVM